jgi:hypothetical protein
LPAFYPVSHSKGSFLSWSRPSRERGKLFRGPPSHFERPYCPGRNKRPSADGLSRDQTNSRGGPERRVIYPSPQSAKWPFPSQHSTPFFRRAPDSTPSRSGPALRSGSLAAASDSAARRARAWCLRLCLFLGSAFTSRVLVEGPSKLLNSSYSTFVKLDLLMRPLQLQSAYQATRPPPEICRGGRTSQTPSSPRVDRDVQNLHQWSTESESPHSRRGGWRPPRRARGWTAPPAGRRVGADALPLQVLLVAQAQPTTAQPRVASSAPEVTHPFM